jgi:hypothetical protein
MVVLREEGSIGRLCESTANVMKQATGEQGQKRKVKASEADPAEISYPSRLGLLFFISEMSNLDQNRV